MQAQAFQVKIPVAQSPSITSMRPHISPRTFVHCLNALYVNTQVLAANVVSLHLSLAGQDKCPDATLILLSRLQLDLVEQTTALRRHIGLFRGVPAPVQEWICYAELWRIPEVADLPTTSTLLLNATDLLMDLYESMLPAASGQYDRAVSYYLLAGHLVALNEHWQALESCIQHLEVSTM
ncbi:MAG TPA: hypothetical protein PK228_06760 [Saprospiraceae bacterium]|nr:hypothetical protein [Saprospiraceae bacterium]